MELIMEDVIKLCTFHSDPFMMSNTFFQCLHGDLQEELYSEVGRVCKLCKFLYGLKQSPVMIWEV